MYTISFHSTAHSSIEGMRLWCFDEFYKKHYRVDVNSDVYLDVMNVIYGHPTNTWDKIHDIIKNNIDENNKSLILSA